MQQNWIILGASSSMARAFARKAATEGCNLLLAGRDLTDLRQSAKDCVLRGAPSAKAVKFDARLPAGFAPILETAGNWDGAINVAVFVSSMPEQADVDADPSILDLTIQDGFTGPTRFLHMIAPMMEDRGCGTIVGIGSVAGDRGRVGNYVYGATKAGFATYLSGLRNRLARKGVHVLTVKPGFVDTTMTWGLDGLFLVAAPADVADAIWRAIAKQRNEIYLPFFWRYIMLIIRHIPEMIFKKLSI
ncbi:MAG TPA: SDR family NAD(P)-dependent oxidoreductase [Paracoccaceae bacterium]|nr:SDR family NAD(P)-dependent oxidoreductase [Paracoccaceae bacterium]